MTPLQVYGFLFAIVLAAIYVGVEAAFRFLDDVRSNERRRP